MPTRHAEWRTREVPAELRSLIVMGTNGTQAKKKVRELGEELRDTEDQIEFLCFHTVPVDLRVPTKVSYLIKLRVPGFASFPCLLYVMLMHTYYQKANNYQI